MTSTSSPSSATSSAPGLSATASASVWPPELASAAPSKASPRDIPAASATPSAIPVRSLAARVHIVEPIVVLPTTVRALEPSSVEPSASASVLPHVTVRDFLRIDGVWDGDLGASCRLNRDRRGTLQDTVEWGTDGDGDVAPRWDAYRRWRHASAATVRGESLICALSDRATTTTSNGGEESMASYPHTLLHVRRLTDRVERTVLYSQLELAAFILVRLFAASSASRGPAASSTPTSPTSTSTSATLERISGDGTSHSRGM
ncbi:hypothetical protein V8D89_009407 [Ganoderma adspersum]